MKIKSDTPLNHVIINTAHTTTDEVPDPKHSSVETRIYTKILAASTEELPDTGSEAWKLVLAGLSLITSGLVLKRRV